MGGGEQSELETVLESSQNFMVVMQCYIMAHLESCSHTFVSSDNMRESVSLQKLIQSCRAKDQRKRQSEMGGLVWILPYRDLMCVSSSTQCSGCVVNDLSAVTAVKGRHW